MRVMERRQRTREAVYFIMSLPKLQGKLNDKTEMCKKVKAFVGKMTCIATATI